MKFGTMTFLTTLILTTVLTIPVRLAAQSSSSAITSSMSADAAAVRCRFLSVLTVAHPSGAVRGSLVRQRGA